MTFGSLEELAGERIYLRGLAYADEGRVFSIRRDGSLLHGQVTGTDLYETRVDLNDPSEYDCTCPYEGFCKHVVALAVTWLEKDEPPSGWDGNRLAARTAALMAQVDAMDEGELRPLVRTLIDTAPGVWVAVEEFLVRRGVEALMQVPASARADAAAVRRTLRAILTRGMKSDSDRDPDDAVYQRLMDRQVATLIESVEKRRSVDSLPFRLYALVECILELVAVGPGSVPWRWEKEVTRMAQRAASLLADPACPEPVAEEVISSLVAGYLMADGTLVEPLRAVLLAASGRPLRRESLLAELERGSESADEKRRARLFRLVGEVRARIGEYATALDAFSRASPTARMLLDLAHKSLGGGDMKTAALAARLACDRAEQGKLRAIRREAAEVQAAAGDHASAQAALLENFVTALDHAAAADLLERAEGEERQRLAGVMLERGGKEIGLELRMWLCLDAGRDEEAVGLVRILGLARPELYGSVAQRIAGRDLDTASELWRKAVGGLIGGRSRPAYARATRALLEMRWALLEAGRGTAWREYYQELLARHDRYWALKEELTKAGLSEG